MPSDALLKIIEPIYGSDNNGLVWGYLFVAGQPARPIGLDVVGEYLAAPLQASLQAPLDAFLWLHFSLSNAATIPWLRNNLSLPDAFHKSLHGNVGSTSLEARG